MEYLAADANSPAWHIGLDQATDLNKRLGYKAFMNVRHKSAVHTNGDRIWYADSMRHIVAKRRAKRA